MPIDRIEHVQLAMPPGEEAAAVNSYEGLLRIDRVPKPAHLAVRGGCWFERGNVKLHLGVEQDFRPATKAHPALLVTGLAERVEGLRSAHVLVVDDEPLEGYDPGLRVRPVRQPHRAHGARRSAIAAGRCGDLTPPRIRRSRTWALRVIACWYQKAAGLGDSPSRHEVAEHPPGRLGPPNKRDHEFEDRNGTTQPGARGNHGPFGTHQGTGAASDHGYSSLRALILSRSTIVARYQWKIQSRYSSP